jgi:hypothetical protein
MNSARLKLVILGIFAVGTVFVFFSSGERSGAQKDPKSILELAAGYKTWQRPVKPPQIQNRPLEPMVIAAVAPTDVISVANSTGFG